MNTGHDNIFVMGDGHKICDDYAWSGMIQGRFPCAIISDGCSQSKFTDIGSRILVMGMISTLNLLKLEKNTPEENYHLINHLLGETISGVRESMGLPINSLDATILMALKLDDGLFTFTYGDGCMIIRNHTTDSIAPFRVDYPFNAPYYFNYTLNDDMKMSYLEKFKDETVNLDGHIATVEEHVNDHRSRYDWFPCLDDGHYTVTVMSDGVDTFFEGDINLSPSEVWKDITAFKNFKGEYVKRKVGMFLHRHAKKNIKHYDDIAVASIRFELKEDES